MVGKGWEVSKKTKVEKRWGLLLVSENPFPLLLRYDILLSIHLFSQSWEILLRSRERKGARKEGYE